MYGSFLQVTIENMYWYLILRYSLFITRWNMTFTFFGTQEGNF